MNINILYKRLGLGYPAAEEELFDKLAVSFRLIVNLKVWNQQDGEEIVQDALMTVAREYKTLDVRTSFSAWAHRVLEYRMLSHFRSRERMAQRTVNIPNGDSLSHSSPPPDPILSSRLRKCLEKVRQANRRYARAMILHYQGYRPDEIRQRLNISRENFYMILSRARGMLKRCLEKGEGLTV